MATSPNGALHTTAHLKKAFLDAFSQTGIVLAAAEAAGVPRRNVYYWLEHDERFALAFRQAEEDSTQRLEREAWRRAADGVEKLSASGRPYTDYSDTLLIFLLKARRPERYRDRYEVRHSGSAEAPVKVEVGFTPEAADVGTGYPTS